MWTARRSASQALPLDSVQEYTYTHTHHIHIHIYIYCKYSTRSYAASSSLALMHSLEFLFFLGSALNIHYALYGLPPSPPFLSLSSLSGKCAFTHFHGALFCPLNIRWTQDAVNGRGMAGLQDPQCHSGGPTGTHHTSPAGLAITSRLF